MTINKNGLTIEVSSDCDVVIEGDKITIKSIASREVHREQSVDITCNATGWDNFRRFLTPVHSPDYPTPGKIS